MGMATLDHVKLIQEVAGPAETKMTGFLAMANAWAVSEIGCDMTQGIDRTERLSGDGRSLLFPTRWPVTKVSALRIDSLDVDLTVMTWATVTDAQQNVYLPEHGWYLEMRDPFSSLLGLGLWPVGSGNVKITYDHGYAAADMPADLTGAIAQMTLLLWQERDRIGAAALSIGDRSVAQVVRKLEEYPSIVSAVQRYQRVRLG